MTLWTGPERAVNCPAGLKARGPHDVSRGEQLLPRGPGLSQEQVTLPRGAENAGPALAATSVGHGGPALAHRVSQSSLAPTDAAKS